MESGYFHSFPSSPLTPPIIGNTKYKMNKRTKGNVPMLNKEPLNNDNGEAIAPMIPPINCPANISPIINV